MTNQVLKIEVPADLPIHPILSGWWRDDKGIVHYSDDMFADAAKHALEYHANYYCGNPAWLPIFIQCAAYYGTIEKLKDVFICRCNQKLGIEQPPAKRSKP